MIVQLDEPTADPAALHMKNICKTARDNGIFVLLVGLALMIYSVDTEGTNLYIIIKYLIFSLSN